MKKDCRIYTKHFVNIASNSGDNTRWCFFLAPRMKQCWRSKRLNATRAIDPVTHHCIWHWNTLKHTHIYIYIYLTVVYIYIYIYIYCFKCMSFHLFSKIATWAALWREQKILNYFIWCKSTVVAHPHIVAHGPLNNSLLINVRYWHLVASLLCCW